MFHLWPEQLFLLLYAGEGIPHNVQRDHHTEASPPMSALWRCVQNENYQTASFQRGRPAGNNKHDNRYFYNSNFRICNQNIVVTIERSCAHRQERPLNFVEEKKYKEKKEIDNGLIIEEIEEIFCTNGKDHFAISSQLILSTLWRGLCKPLLLSIAKKRTRKHFSIKLMVRKICSANWFLFIETQFFLFRKFHFWLRPVK